MFPVLIPTLTAIPMSVFNARALASLVTVARNALSRRSTVILNSLDNRCIILQRYEAFKQFVV